MSKVHVAQLVKIGKNTNGLCLVFVNHKLVSCFTLHRFTGLFLFERSDRDEALLLKGEAAKIVYRNGVKSVPDDVPFHVKFLEIVTLFLPSSYAASILKEIKENLLEVHFDEPKVQSVIARLHLNPNIGSNKSVAKIND